MTVPRVCTTLGVDPKTSSAMVCAPSCAFLFYPIVGAEYLTRIVQKGPGANVDPNKAAVGPLKVSCGAATLLQHLPTAFTATSIQNSLGIIHSVQIAPDPILPGWARELPGFSSRQAAPPSPWSSRFAARCIVHLSSTGVGVVACRRRVAPSRGGWWLEKMANKGAQPTHPPPDAHPHPAH